MECDPRNTAFRCLLRAVFAVSDHGMAECRKLYPDLILQSGHQGDSHQRRCAERAFDGIPEFCAGRLPVAFCAKFLVHSFPAEIVNDRFFFRAETPANDGQILPNRRMRKKLSNQRFPIAAALCEEQHSGGETIDTMHDQSSLPARLKRMRQKRQCRRRV